MDRVQTILKKLSTRDEVVCFGTSTLNATSLASAEVLADTTQMNNMDSEVVLLVDGEEFRFKVMENQILSPIFQL